MTLRHHPEDTMLLAYVSAAADDARDLVVATHLSLCPACRARVAELEGVGGALLDELAPVAGGVDEDDALAAIFGASEPGAAAAPPPSGPAWLPEPLRSRVGPIDGDAWRRLVPGLITQIPLQTDQGTLRLVRMRPGAVVPEHGHEGDELNLVLTGGFSQQGEHYARGDLAVADASVEHVLRVDEGEDCVILQYLGGPVAPRTLLGRLVGKLSGEC